MARKNTSAVEPETDGIVRTPEWPDGICINPHVTDGCDGRCAPEPDFQPDASPDPEPAPLPDKE